MTRRGDWMQTFTGRQFWPLDPRADEIHIEDIAHSLSMQCRYAGHSLRFYSVAEHCCHIAREANAVGGPTMGLWGLLHDASETYLVDVPRPLKPHLTGYGQLEAHVMVEVCDRFNLPVLMPKQVHEMDGAILRDEAEQNMALPPVPWDFPTDWSLGVTLGFWTPEVAEAEFIRMYDALELARNVA